MYYLYYQLVDNVHWTNFAWEENIIGLDYIDEYTTCCYYYNWWTTNIYFAIFYSFLLENWDIISWWWDMILFEKRFDKIIGIFLLENVEDAASIQEDLLLVNEAILDKGEWRSNVIRK